jgi:hypothetical protein
MALEVSFMIVIFFIIQATNIMILNDTARAIRSDAPSCGITYEHHSVNSRGVTYAPREHL